MKKLLCLLILTISTSAFAKSDTVTVDAYALCPSLDAYIVGYNVMSYQVEECIEAVDGKTFQKEPALMCLSLKYYSNGYNFTAHEVIDCFKKITGKTYSAARINYCQHLKNMNLRNGYNTLPSDVYECLK